MLTRIVWLSVLLLLPLPVAADPRDAAADQFTPVVILPLTPWTEPVLGTDGKFHVVYELTLANAKPVVATLTKLTVIDAYRPDRVLAAYQGADLLSRLRTLGNTFAGNPEIEFNGSRLFLIDLGFESRSEIPRNLLHHVDLLAASIDSTEPNAVPTAYSVSRIAVAHPTAAVIGPPLAGKHWVAINGCCDADGVHRNTGLPVNGKIRFAQRYAIDWMRLDGQGRLAHGDLTDVHSYAAYGADVLAVADGVVVDALDALEDQRPPSLPAPSTITLGNVDGNHVVLDIGNGLFAFYAHLQQGGFGVRVKRGDRVKRGQLIGKLGNSGNSSAPHLHFHVMDGPSVLGSNGVPYHIDRFFFAGQIEGSEFTGFDQSWTRALLARALPRHREFPLDFNIVDFSD